jgi:hypothetical protein
MTHFDSATIVGGFPSGINTKRTLVFSLGMFPVNAWNNRLEFSWLLFTGTSIAALLKFEMQMKSPASAR